MAYAGQLTGVVDNKGGDLALTPLMSLSTSAREIITFHALSLAVWQICTAVLSTAALQRPLAPFYEGM